MTTSDVRAVIDTSVIVSAVLLPNSIPRRAFDAVRSNGRMLLSEATIVELEEVLRRDKFNKYIPEANRLEFLAAFVREAEVIKVEITVVDCRDPKDNKFLELAIEGNASYVISSDADLLVLHPFRGISIVSPKAFFEAPPQ
jgi:putative PIN family toxin of toxin-antitoxin system